MSLNTSTLKEILETTYPPYIYDVLGGIGTNLNEHEMYQLIMKQTNIILAKLIEIEKKLEELNIV